MIRWIEPLGRHRTVPAVLSGLAVFGLTVALSLLLPASAEPQQYQVIGKGKCVNCHDHDKEKLWSEKQDGPPPKNHLNALNQMDNKKSDMFAKAIGLADPYDAKGACARCHATVLKGQVVDGVTCETCHGPGSGYLDIHQQKGMYLQAVAKGMADTLKHPETWAPICMKCHVMDDKRLVAAGHPAGDDFDLGAKFATVALHWKSAYPNKADISVRGRNAAAPLLAAVKGAAPPAAAPPTPTPPPPPVPVTQPNPPPPPPPTVSIPTPVPPLPITAPPAIPTGGAGGAGRAAPPPPKDANTPVPPGRGGAPAAARGTSGAGNGTGSESGGGRSTPPVAAPQMTGLPPASVPASPPPADTTAVTPPAGMSGTMAMPTLPLSPAAAVAAVQGRVVALLDGLLRRDGRAVVRIAPPDPKIQYRGADAELLALQQEVIALATEALGTAPVRPTPAPAGATSTPK